MPETRLPPTEAARERHGASVDAMAAWFDVGDPVWPLEDAPDVVTPPRWLDPGRCDRGGRALRRHGLLTAAVLRGYCLPLSYLSRHGVKPLVMTGQLLESPASRLHRTATFVRATHAEGAMHPGGEGWRWSARVRTIHQRVRRRLRSRGWPRGLGAPMPQPDLAATALLFGPMLVHGLRRLGADIGREEADDVAHLARAIAHGQGVVDALQADEHVQAMRLFERLTVLNPPPAEDGRRLMAQLLDVPFEVAATSVDHALAPLVKATHRSLGAELLGEEDARALGLVDSGRLARALARLAAPSLHHPRLTPIHDAMVGWVLARNRRRLEQRRRASTDAVDERRGGRRTAALHLAR